jgi:hypothetical protein
MSKATRIMWKWMTWGTCGGLLFSGGCLPDNFWADLWANNIVAGTTDALLAKVLASVGL